MTKVRNQLQNKAHQLTHEAIDASKAPGFAFFDKSDVRNRFEWHTHDKHQLLFVHSGVVMVQTRNWVLTSHRTQAVLIPAGIEHETTISLNCSFGSIFLDSSFLGNDASRCLSVAVEPLLHALLNEARRWENPQADDSRARRFFGYLADVVEENGQTMSALTLPAPRSERVRALVALALEQLETARLSRLSFEVGLPERTARRLIQAELGMDWRRFVRLARVSKASQLLDTGNSAISEIAYSVGFESLSAFTHAFKELTGYTPSHWRTREKVS